MSDDGHVIDAAPSPWAERCRACLVAGAVGDALGADVEFDSIAGIRERFGPAGLTGYASTPGRITDDTQMTLFTAEGLIRSAHIDRCSRRGDGPDPHTDTGTADAPWQQRGVPKVAEVLWASYRRWLLTQDHHPDESVFGSSAPGSGWLLGRRELWSARAPGLTCMKSLRSGRMGRPGEPMNESKGCGGVMRVAPVGLVASEPFLVASQAAAITHAHPSGYLSAGTFAAVLGALVDGSDLLGAVGVALDELTRWDGHEETEAAVHAALDLAARHPVPDPELVERLGGGWTGEEALAIALYCALCAPDLRSGVLWAVNHSGDSDSTGSVAGNLLGLVHGSSAIPAEWADGLAELELVVQVADDLALAFPVPDPAEPVPDEDLLARYPASE